MNLKEEFGTGFEQNVHFWIMHPYPPKADRSIVRGYWVFVFMESRTKDYASECNELTVPEDSSLIGLGLDSSEVKQKSQIIQGG
ncbi:MAG: hypothetical protein OEZ20_07300 [candidate division WOR-3 bacterium]|nr:hypothetical protein [candidate division WOR-3 bacterium]MDH5684253.1 hypothetical protein [candidate division WOR-3 bacterium]